MRAGSTANTTLGLVVRYRGGKIKIEKRRDTETHPHIHNTHACIHKHTEREGKVPTQPHTWTESERELERGRGTQRGKERGLTRGRRRGTAAAPRAAGGGASGGGARWAIVGAGHTSGEVEMDAGIYMAARGEAGCGCGGVGEMEMVLVAMMLTAVGREGGGA